MGERGEQSVGPSEPEDDPKLKEQLAEARRRGLVDSHQATLEQIAHQADAELPGDAAPAAAETQEQERLAAEERRRREERLKVVTGEALLTAALTQSQQRTAQAATAAQRAQERTEAAAASAPATVEAGPGGHPTYQELFERYHVLDRAAFTLSPKDAAAEATFYRAVDDLDRLLAQLDEKFRQSPGSVQGGDRLECLALSQEVQAVKQQHARARQAVQQALTKRNDAAAVRAFRNDIHNCSEALVVIQDLYRRLHLLRRRIS